MEYFLTFRGPRGIHSWKIMMREYENTHIGLILGQIWVCFLIIRGFPLFNSPQNYEGRKHFNYEQYEISWRKFFSFSRMMRQNWIILLEWCYTGGTAQIGGSTRASASSWAATAGSASTQNTHGKGSPRRQPHSNHFENSKARWKLISLTVWAQIWTTTVAQH